MPIYEYQCASCHHAFELIQKVNDDVAKTCEQCGQDTAVRLVSAPGFQLKGTGWYATDFKDKPKPKPKPNEASDHSPSDDKTSSDDPKSAEKKTEVDQKTTAETKTTVTTGTGESD